MKHSEELSRFYARCLAGFIILITLGVFYIIRKQSNPPIPRPIIGTMRSFDVDEMSYHYAVSGEGPVVVLYPSLGRTGSDFNELVSSLNGSGFRTLVLEPRGFKNGAGTKKDDITLFDYSSDIKAVLDHENLAEGQGVFLIGHAFGNRVVRAFGSKYPKQVRSMVLLAAGPQKSKDAKDEMNQAFREIFYFFLSDAWREKRVGKVFFSDPKKVPDYWVAGWSDQISKSQVKALNNTELGNWERGGGVPMLVIQGADDALTPPEIFSEAIKKKLQDQVTISMIDGAGHALLPEQPDMIKDQVIRFLQGSNLSEGT